MGDRKSARRTPFSRNEGIWRRIPGTDRESECSICGAKVNNSRLVQASHGKKHVREGRAVVRIEPGAGGYPRQMFYPHNGTA